MEKETLAVQMSDRKVGLVPALLCVESGLKSVPRQLDVHSKLEVRATTRFLWAKRLDCMDIHLKIISVAEPVA